MQGATRWLQLGYLFAWPGMDAASFLNGRLKVEPACIMEWSFAGFKLGVGICFLYVAATRLIVDDYLVGWIGMIGTILVLHFGTFHLLSCAWRSVGVNASPLMNWPWTSASLSEFWGKRWNTAFRDIIYRFAFRPLAPRLGARAALMSSFVASGLIHDLVISFPACSGYGWPTVFFAIQGVGVLAERSPVGQRLGLGAGVGGRLFATVVLLLPITWLFHRPFVLRIMVPFTQFLGGIQ